jgi:hypothetical protein
VLFSLVNCSSQNCLPIAARCGKGGASQGHPDRANKDGVQKCKGHLCLIYLLYTESKIQRSKIETPG